MSGLHMRGHDQDSYHHDPSQPQPREQRVSYLKSELPPAFWDGLPEIPLTRNALKELDRRNAETTRNLAPESDDMSSNNINKGQSNSSSATTKTENTGPYDNAFNFHLIQNGIYPPDYIDDNDEDLPKPDN